MNRTTITECHSLKLLPLRRVTRFVRIKSEVDMSLLGDPIDPIAVPGSLKVSHSEDNENGTIRKKITYQCSDVTARTANQLEILKVTRLIATYVDESGQNRVSGSPNWPLSLDFTDAGGVFSVTLEGEDTANDGFITR